jgi:hypothetical protein
MMRSVVEGQEDLACILLEMRRGVARFERPAHLLLEKPPAMNVKQEASENDPGEVHLRILNANGCPVVTFNDISSGKLLEGFHVINFPSLYNCSHVL